MLAYLFFQNISTVLQILERLQIPIKYCPDIKPRVETPFKKEFHSLTNEETHF
jgi:hypothetical protein